MPEIEKIRVILYRRAGLPIRGNLLFFFAQLYLRTLIVGKEIHPRSCTHHADLLRKVAGLCNNANQLAHRANSTGTAGQGSVDEMTRLTQEVWREVKENW